jgi:hypothetical protein
MPLLSADIPRRNWNPATAQTSNPRFRLNAPKDPAGRKPPTGWRSRYGPIPRAGAVCAACVRYKRKRLQPRRTGAVSLSAPERPDALVSPGPLRAAPKSLQQMRRTKTPAVTAGHRKYPFQVMQCLRLFGRKRGVYAKRNIAISSGAKSNSPRFPKFGWPPRQEQARPIRLETWANQSIRPARSRTDSPPPLWDRAFLPSKLSCLRKGRQFRRRSQETTRTSRHHNVARPQPLGERAEASADLGA